MISLFLISENNPRGGKKSTKFMMNLLCRRNNIN